MRIVLISCVKSKEGHPCKAKDMYISPLFKGGYNYAKQFQADRIYILSAKYGLLHEDDFIYPYNETLKDKNEHEKKIWSYKIIQSLIKDGCNLNQDEFIILAGIEYRKYIIQKFTHYKIPNEGLSLGQQISKYSKMK